ncbi:MAG: hypothetical protein AABX11_06775 [Nanoarchaeota archaeon]
MSERQNYSCSLFARITAKPTSGMEFNFSYVGRTFSIRTNLKQVRQDKPIVPVVISYFPAPHIAKAPELDAFSSRKLYEYFRNIGATA